jgi:methyl-accepting chemotaxis protein
MISPALVPAAPALPHSDRSWPDAARHDAASLVEADEADAHGDVCDDADWADQVDAATATLAGVIVDTGDRATQLVDHATTVLCLTSVMSTQLGGVAERAAGVADQAATIAGRSRDAATAVAEIRLLVDDARDAVQALGATVQDIGRISATLQRMALETRMVGLNAAIEAARAGSAGAGFAVVAEKVRELADGANAASEQIIAHLTVVRDNARRSATVMERVGRDVEGIDAHAVQIAEAATHQERGIGEIASGLTDATTSVDEIVRHVEDVTETGMALSTQAQAGRHALEALAALQATPAGGVCDERAPRPDGDATEYGT